MNEATDTPKIEYSVGAYLIIWITGVTSTYIAEIIRTDPLEMKVEESGPYSRLRQDDFIINEDDSTAFQRDIREGRADFLKSEIAQGRKVISGLKSLGIADGKVHEILPHSK